MKELLAYMVRNIVEHPEDVSVTQESGADGASALSLRVHSEDMGKVIGRGGRTIRDIRLIVKAAGSQNEQKVTVDLVE